jgi:hypothetical protein
MLVDRAELRACIARKGYIQAQVAQMVGISLQWFRTKLEGKKEFTESEIKKLINEFGKDFLILD